jgi:hypothetical protein
MFAMSKPRKDLFGGIIETPFASSRGRRHVADTLMRRKYKSEYRAWRSMKTRVLNPNCNENKYYKKPGTKICDGWLNSFENFLEDMGPKPRYGLTLERSNNDGNYEPDNCCWATRSEQNRNRSNVKLTKNKAHQIKNLYETGIWTQDQLAYFFGTKQDSISMVVLNKQW